jgi:allantoate deiminase
VAAFADEEGLRFHTSYLGSKVFAGTFDPAYLELRDPDGITLAEVIREMGGDPEALPGDRRAAGDLLGYCEVHIEQGPVLEAEGLPVGVVSAIAGQTRFSLTFEGEAGHAGTVPMSMRRDALCAAADFVLAVEALGKSREGLVATVGQMEVEPGASNVIPGRAALSLDVRHIADAVREEAGRLLRDRAEEICEKRDVALAWNVLQSNPSTPCDPALAGKLARAVEAAGYTVRYLPSGAGHDAVTMSAIAPAAMLFVRCKGGISHNPAESVLAEDVEAAIQVTGRFLDLLGEEQVVRQA